MLALLVVAGCQSPPKSEPAPFVVTSGRGFQMLKPNSTNTVVTDDQPYYVLSAEQLILWFHTKQKDTTP